MKRERDRVIRPLDECFPDVEALSSALRHHLRAKGRRSMWKPTSDWKPARFGGSGAIAVEKVLPPEEPKQYGLAKPDGMRNEYLASALASCVGVRVPKNEIDQVEGKPNLFSVSYAHGKESIDITLMRAHTPDKFNSAEVQCALRGACRMIPFYAWTATTDFKDDHLVIDALPDGSYEVAGIDFQHSFNWGAPDGGPLENLGLPPCLATCIDKNDVLEGIAAIEAMTDEQIRDIVNSLPTSVANDADKKRLSDGLIGRKSNVREAMQKQGWIS